MPPDDAPKVRVQGLFATPVVAANLPGAAAINAELKAAILARMEAQASTDRSNLGGWQSTLDLASWGGPAAARVLEHARRIADAMTTDRAGGAVRIAWKTNAWANVNRTGDGNEVHAHPGSFWSGTYYVDDGGVAADPALGGEFEVRDPRGVGPAMYAPALAMKVPGGASAGASELVRPEAGLMLLFPAWLPHAVRPYRGGAQRISVAFNFSL